MPYRIPAKGPSAFEVKRAEAEAAKRKRVGGLTELIARTILRFKADTRDLRERVHGLPVDGEHY